MMQQVFPLSDKGHPSMPDAVAAFDDASTRLLAALSKRCLESSSHTLKALGFWLRPAHLKQIRQAAERKRIRPRGTVIQIAPGNVDTLFIYVTLLALWLGNRVWVRLSSRQGDDEARLLSMFETLYADPALRPALERIVLLRSDYADPQWLALLREADMRIVWGSDATLEKIASLPKAAHCHELRMGHKHSLCLIGADALLELPAERWCPMFMRDSLEFAQQGCSSSRTLVWWGAPERVEKARSLFWAELEAYAGAKGNGGIGRYQLNDSQRMERLIALQQMALEGVLSQPWQQHGTFVSVQVSGLESRQEQMHPGLGVLYEWSITSLDDMKDQLKPWHQTLTCLGVDRETVVEWAVCNAVPGLDRIEPVGQALVFDPVWDGFDLVAELSRQLRS
ncbi:MAG: hypothetical protein GYB21_12800 [Oceanospirillales bacterium]|nr:hypothetical protein [Oceanospirillales bacterium]